MRSRGPEQGFRPVNPGVDQCMRRVDTGRQQGGSSNGARSGTMVKLNRAFQQAQRPVATALAPPWGGRPRQRSHQVGAGGKGRVIRRLQHQGDWRRRRATGCTAHRTRTALGIEVELPRGKAAAQAPLRADGCVTIPLVNARWRSMRISPWALFQLQDPDPRATVLGGGQLGRCHRG